MTDKFSHIPPYNYYLVVEVMRSKDIVKTNKRLFPVVLNFTFQFIKEIYNDRAR